MNRLNNNSKLTPNNKQAKLFMTPITLYIATLLQQAQAHVLNESLLIDHVISDDQQAQIPNDTVTAVIEESDASASIPQKNTFAKSVDTEILPVAQSTMSDEVIVHKFIETMQEQNHETKTATNTVHHNSGFDYDPELNDAEFYSMTADEAASDPGFNYALWGVVVAVVAVAVVGIVVATDSDSKKTTVADSETAEEETEPAFSLSLLYTSDLELNVADTENVTSFAAIAQALKDGNPNSILLSVGDSIIPGVIYAAGGAPEMKSVLNEFYNALYGLTPDLENPGTFAYEDLRPTTGAIDIGLMNQIAFDINVLGNHEFDKGELALFNLISQYARYEFLDTDRNVGYQYPYLSANLEFKEGTPLSSISSPDIISIEQFGVSPEVAHTVVEKYGGDGEVHIAPATYVEIGGELVGFVGYTTPVLSSISNISSDVTTVKGGGTLTDYPTTEAEYDMAASSMAAVVQPYVDALTEMGINKIFVLGHDQSAIIGQTTLEHLYNVDGYLSGGGHGSSYLGNALEMTNANGDLSIFMSNPTGYKNLSDTTITFDENGIVLSQVSQNYAANPETVTKVGGNLSSTNIENIQILLDGVGEIIIAKDTEIYGYTDVYLSGENVRIEQTNLSTLYADTILAAAQVFDPAVVAAIWNAGAIRDSLGVIIEGEKTISPAKSVANDGFYKAAGTISTLDIETVDVFNNDIVIGELTRYDLRTIIEHSVSSSALGETPGKFGVPAGITYSFDWSKDFDLNTEGQQRIWDLDLVNAETNEIIDIIVQDGIFLGDPGAKLTIATNDFLAGGGDSYPFDDVLQGITEIGVTSQEAVKDYLSTHHGTQATAYNLDDATMIDDRVINLAIEIEELVDGVL